MSFENLISNLSDQKVIKAISKPIPKKIISCIGEDSFTASEIADKISFPKEKIYYHIKKLVAFKILTVSETNEIKGIIQKKYRLVEISSSLKKDSLYDDGHENDSYINEKLKTKIIEVETASKFEYVKAIANKMMGNSSASEIVIQKYQTNSKIKKLSSVISNTRKDINSVKENIESIIAQISLYNDSDQLYANHKRLIQENEQFSKRIDSYKKDIALSNDKISIIKKNQIDFSVINGENAADDGKGITKEIAEELFNLGIDVITSGNHIWDKEHTTDYIEKENRLLRPANLAEGSPGKGFGIYFSKNKKFKIGVINLMGNVYMRKTDDAFVVAKNICKKIILKKNVDFCSNDPHTTAERPLNEPQTTPERPWNHPERPPNDSRTTLEGAVWEFPSTILKELGN